jgi:uncharacterized protein (DUF58 family)
VSATAEEPGSSTEPRASAVESEDAASGGSAAETAGPVVRTTGRWWYATVVALGAGAVGAVTASPAALLVAVVGVATGAAVRAVGAPDPDLTIERELSTASPTPGDVVEVTTTLRNEGGPLPDVRVVDGVPSALEVVDGTPRAATALRSGQAVTLSYAVEAVRGEHGFRPATVAVRSPGGAEERSVEVAAGTTLPCTPSLSSVPLRSQTSEYTGSIRTDRGGSGLEFHSLREYRAGDPVSRVAWRHLAETGELATVDFHEERSATVVLVVDARPEAYVARAPDERHAVEHAVGAASGTFATLLAGGDRVGVTALGPERLWLAPGAGNDHLARARHVFATHTAFDYDRPGDEPPEPAIFPDHDPVAVDWLRARLAGDAQVFLFSPLADDAVANAAVAVDAGGHPVTVVSPDVTARDTQGGRLAAVQRANRLGRCRQAGLRVVDWDPRDPFAVALQEARRAER